MLTKDDWVLTRDITRILAEQHVVASSRPVLVWAMWKLWELDIGSEFWATVSVQSQRMNDVNNESLTRPVAFCRSLWARYDAFSVSHPLDSDSLLDVCPFRSVTEPPVLFQTNKLPQPQPGERTRGHELDREQVSQEVISACTQHLWFRRLPILQ